MVKCYCKKNFKPFLSRPTRNDCAKPIDTHIPRLLRIKIFYNKMVTPLRGDGEFFSIKLSVVEFAFISALQKRCYFLLNFLKYSSISDLNSMPTRSKQSKRSLYVPFPPKKSQNSSATFNSEFKSNIPRIVHRL